MPRRRPRTRLHMLSDAIVALQQADACLHEINLRTTSQEVRAELKAAREQVAIASKQAQQAYRLSAEEALKPAVG